MNNWKKIILSGVAVLAVVSAVRLDVTSFASAAAVPFSGWAWGATDAGGGIGWTSFNCEQGGSCPASDYKIERQDDGALTGFAWNDAIGWIQFNPPQDSKYPNGYPEAPYEPARLAVTNSPATGDGGLVGWARACSVFRSGCSGQLLAMGTGGWDGWIKLSGSTDGGGDDYGVSYTASTKRFANSAWAGELGWIEMSSVSADDTTVTNNCEFSVLNISDQTVNAGDSIVVPVHIDFAATAQASDSVESFSITGLPAGVTASAFSPDSCAATPGGSCDTSVTLTASSAVSGGDPALGILASGDGCVAPKENFTLHVNPIDPFLPSLSYSPLSPIVPGATSPTRTVVSVRTNSGTPERVQFEMRSVPAGFIVSDFNTGDPFDPAQCTPDCSTPLQILVDASVSLGTHLIRVGLVGHAGVFVDIPVEVINCTPPVLPGDPPIDPRCSVAFTIEHNPRGGAHPHQQFDALVEISGTTTVRPTRLSIRPNSTARPEDIGDIEIWVDDVQLDTAGCDLDARNPDFEHCGDGVGDGTRPTEQPFVYKYQNITGTRPQGHANRVTIPGTSARFNSIQFDARNNLAGSANGGRYIVTIRAQSVPHPSEVAEADIVVVVKKAENTSTNQ